MDTTSEAFIGVCEMETDSWACGNCETLVGTHVYPDGDEHSEYRYVCVSCAQRFGEDSRGQQNDDSEGSDADWLTSIGHGSDEDYGDYSYSDE